MTRKWLFISLLCFITATGNAARSLEDSISVSLRKLDEIISTKQIYQDSLRVRIDKANDAYKGSETYREQYEALRSLFDLYRNYKIDSALIIADKRLQIARKLDDKQKIASASLNLAEGFVKSGEADRAIYILDSLDKNILAPHQLKYRNNIYKTAYSDKAFNALLPQERVEVLENLKKYRENELLEADPDSRVYLFLQAERLKDAGMYREAAAKLDEAHARFNIGGNPALLYMLGETYLDSGREDEAIAALAQAAILDISSASREYKSLILLASILFDKGEIDRSFAYLNCALDDAMFSKAHIRTEEIISLMPDVYSAFSKKEKEIKRRTVGFSIAIGVLNFILIILLALFIREHKIKKSVIKEIRNINNTLEKQNRRLEESDRLKMEQLKKFMFAYASHISRLKSFRKNILRLLKTGQYTKAIDRVKDDNDESPATNAFQDMFDAVFLSIFPDFIEILNNFLKIPVDKTAMDKLTPEFRLAALMKLGITSTNEISEMFQYSPQSVYNLRSSLRGMIKVSWEEFEDEIKKG